MHFTLAFAGPPRVRRLSVLGCRFSDELAGLLEQVFPDSVPEQKQKPSSVEQGLAELETWLDSACSRLEPIQVPDDLEQLSPLIASHRVSTWSVCMCSQLFQLQPSLFHELSRAWYW